MRVFNIVIIVLNTILFFSLGLLLIATALTDSSASALSEAWRWYEASLATSMGMKLAMTLVGAGLMTLAVSTVVGNIQNRRYERTVVFHNPHGEVMIALGALEDLGK